MAGSYFSWQFIVTLYLQDTLGWSPLKLALALLPVGLMVAASAVFSDKLVNRFGTARIIAVTMAVMAVGYLLFLRIDTTPSYPTMILPAVLLIGVGWIGFPADQHPGDQRRRGRRAGSGGRRAADLDAGRRRDRARGDHGGHRLGRRRRHLAGERARRLPPRSRLRHGGVDRRRAGRSARAVPPPAARPVTAWQPGLPQPELATTEV